MSLEADTFEALASLQKLYVQITVPIAMMHAATDLT